MFRIFGTDQDNEMYFTKVLPEFLRTKIRLHFYVADKFYLQI